MGKVLSEIAIGLSSASQIFPDFDDDVKAIASERTPDVGLAAAFGDVREAFFHASDCLQGGIDEAAKF